MKLPSDTTATNYWKIRVMEDPIIDELKRQLMEHGITKQEHLINYQQNYGGRSDFHGLNLLNWGLIHQKPYHLPSMTVNIEVFHGAPLIQCVDADPQDAMFMDEDGRIYDCSANPMYDSAQNMFLLDTLLDGYAVDIRAYSQVSRSWSELQNDVSKMLEYPDTLTDLYRWGDKIIMVTQGDVMTVYAKREIIQKLAKENAYPPSSKPWWKFW